MSRERARESLNIANLKITSYLAGLIALAVVLKVFEVPYPPAPFLKYDASGIPLALMAFISLKYVFGLLPLYYIASLAVGASLGFDPIGMAMKCLSEASTFAPLVLTYRACSNRLSAKYAGALAIATASISRAATMSLANYIVTPCWLVWAKWVSDLEEAKKIVIFYIPHIVLFNLTLALILAPTSISVYEILKRSGYLK
jgi:riboflavin transporter FmnP